MQIYIPVSPAICPSVIVYRGTPIIRYSPRKAARASESLHSAEPAVAASQEGVMRPAVDSADTAKLREGRYSNSSYHMPYTTPRTTQEARATVRKTRGRCAIELTRNWNQ